MILLPLTIMAWVCFPCTSPYTLPFPIPGFFVQIKQYKCELEITQD